MKSRVGFAVSIGLNFGLLGAFVVLWMNPPQIDQPVTDNLVVFNPDAVPDDTNGRVQINYRSRPDFRFPTNQLPQITWRAIESADYRRYILNLRAIKCPEKTIQDIIVADVNDLFAGRWKEMLTKHAQEFRYWQTGQGLPGYPDESLERQAAALDRERRELLRELLELEVKDSIAQFTAVNPSELALLFLPEERRQLVLAAQEEFNRAQNALLANPSSAENFEAELGALRDAHERRLAGLMSPEERLRYEMSTSSLAMNLRLELAGFEPTEEEFRQIYEARKRQQLEVEVAQVVLGAQIVAQEAAEAEARALQQQVVEAQSTLLEQLGPQRYAQLQRTADPHYQTLMRVSRVNEVSPITANRVYEFQQVAQVEADRVRADQSLSLEQREVALNGIRAETERTINQNLGDAALRAFRQWNERQELERNSVAAGR